MDIVFEELDFQSTPLGDISLRRRTEPKANNVLVYEVKLDEEFLMSSLFTESEIQLSKLGLAALKQNHTKELDIIVGGLGLGYTAVAALEDPTIKTLNVIDVMQPVIDWHQQGLVPLGKEITSDPRCTLIHADFFAVASATDCGFNPADPDKLVHAVLLDIDHSPTHWLNEGNSTFYNEENLSSLANKIYPGGIFGLWSNDPPDVEFIKRLESIFQKAESHVISFPNPYTGGESSCTVYITYKR